MSRNFVWRIVGNVHVDVMTKEAPTFTEWEEMTAEFQQQSSQIRALLVYTEGGAPNAIQRKRLRDTQTQMPKAALLTNSIVARMAMTAVNLFFKDTFRAFTPQEIDEALRYLAIPPADWPEIKKALGELREQLKREGSAL
jgi:hypothetical protein